MSPFRVMRNYFDDEDEDDDFLDEDLINREMEMEKEARTRREFIQNCNDAYRVIESEPDTIIDEDHSPTKKENLINALNRMAALFILREEFEKCSTLKKFVESKIPGAELDPRIEEVKRFLGQ